jgi:electron transport complex protein RnfG
MPVRCRASWAFVLRALLTVDAVLFAAAQSGCSPKARIAEPAPPFPANTLDSVLPAHDNRPGRDCVTVTEGGKQWTFYVAAEKGQYAGAAFESSSAGFYGPIRVLVGVNAAGAVQAIEILVHKETAGVGARVAEPGFRAQFSGKDIVKTRWRTRQRGGDIDQITGATVSSDAVADAVKSGLSVYVKHLDAIRRVAGPAKHAP